MSRSTYKPPEPFEDELDELARSIRQELQAAGFAPAFDGQNAGASEADRTIAAISPDRRDKAAGLRRFLVPLLVVLLVGLVATLVLPLA